MSIGFSSLGVPAELVACLTKLGITDPYPIQSAALPDALAGADVFAQSPTGSGKTVAFALPLVSRIGKARAGRPRGLVLAPTRELAAQIAEVLEPLARVVGRRVTVVYGGVGYKAQLAALRQGVDIVVGCPGRLIDLLERRAVDFADVEVAVIDEADRMADMGFLPAVRRLLDEIKGSRQTMLFSATRSRDVERLVADYQSSPKRHFLDLPSDDVGSRTHEFWRSAREQRTTLTARLVATHGSSIVFCRTKRGVDRLARQLSNTGVVAVALHGDRSQAQRDRALADFRDRRAQVLVGTDVASRGIHVDAVDCVIHFDPPEDEDTYVHRSGRTGRAGASGRVVSLVTADQEVAARRLQQRLNLKAQLSMPPALAAVGTAGTPGSAQPPIERRPTQHTARNASAGRRVQSEAGQPVSRASRRQKARQRADAPTPRANQVSSGRSTRNRQGSRRAS